MTAQGEHVAAQVSAMNPTFRQRWSRQQGNATVSVPCRPLSALMHAHELERGADFLSLDVEGAELLVLETIDPAVFSVILVELDGTDSRKDAAVRARIEAAGLRPAKHVNLYNSELFLKPGVRETPLRRQRGSHFMFKDTLVSGCRRVYNRVAAITSPSVSVPVP